MEHEFRVLRSGAPVDFRALIHSLRLDGHRLDPGDPNAYRCRWGGVITADGPEAEIATPVVPVRPGAARTVAAWAARGRAAVEAALVPDHTLEGFSTHLNVALGDADGSRASLRFARAFAAPLMLLLDRPDSSGLLIRPRPGRLELGGEFCDGERLEAAVVFALGAARAAMGDEDLATVELRVRLDAAVERFGLFTARDAFGGDLYATGRAASLRTRGRGRVTAGEHLAHAWEIARATIAEELSDEELARVDAIVASSDALPVATATDPGVQMPLPPEVDHFATRSRGALRAQPVVATWDATVIQISAARSFYAAVPRAQLPAFIARFDEGALDEHLTGFAARETDGALLADHAQTLRPGLFDALGDPARLLAPERDPDGVMRQMAPRAPQGSPPGSTPTAGTAAGIPVGWPVLANRPGKPGTSVMPTPAHPGGFPWWIPVLIVIGLIGGAVVISGGGDDQPTVRPTATRPSPSPSAPQLFTRVATKPSQSGGGANCDARTLTFRFIELDHPRALVGLPATIVTTGPGITLTFRISGQGEWRATMTRIAGQPPIAESTGTTYKISGGVGCEIKSG